MPTKRECIELSGMLNKDEFTHSKSFNEFIRKHIAKEILIFDKKRNN